MNFKTGSAFPEPACNHWLDTLGSYLSQRQDLDVVIEGHTDNTGSDQIVNDPLSEQRAKRSESSIRKTMYLAALSPYSEASVNTYRLVTMLQPKVKHVTAV